jgi:anti-sigma factor RsiW
MQISDEQLWKLLDGELPDAEAQALKKAAAKDPALRARIEEFSTMKEAVLAGAPEPPPGFPDRVAELAAERSRASVIDLEDARRFLRRALIAAALLAAVGLAFVAADVLPSWVEPAKAADPLLP